jgi:hypothetical protein
LFKAAGIPADLEGVSSLPGVVTFQNSDEIAHFAKEFTDALATRHWQRQI